VDSIILCHEFLGPNTTRRTPSSRGFYIILPKQLYVLCLKRSFLAEVVDVRFLPRFFTGAHVRYICISVHIKNNALVLKFSKSWSQVIIKITSIDQSAPVSLNLMTQCVSLSSGATW